MLAWPASQGAAHKSRQEEGAGPAHHCRWWEAALLCQPGFGFGFLGSSCLFPCSSQDSLYPDDGVDRQGIRGVLKVTFFFFFLCSFPLFPQTQHALALSLLSPALDHLVAWPVLFPQTPPCRYPLLPSSLDLQPQPQLLLLFHNSKSKKCPACQNVMCSW